MPVMSNSAVPLYRQLADLLRARIADGALRDGDRLPSEAQLGEAHGVSRITVRQALAELEQSGVLVRAPGKGTFVCTRPRPIEGLARLSSFSENARAAGREAGYRVLRVGEADAPREVSSRLGITDRRVFVVERVLLANGSPVGVHASHLPLWLARQAPPGTLEPDALARASLYAAVEAGGVALHRGEEWLEPALAGEEGAQRLELEPGSLVQRVRRLVYDAWERPILFEVDTYRPDAYSYRVELFRRG